MSDDGSSASTPSMEDSRTVSVVIPTYNNVGLLRECLSSLRELDYPQERVQVVVVDNASSDGTDAMVSLRFPEVTLVKMDRNTGFAEACNRGAREATGDYVALLNDDAVADADWLNGLFAGLDAGGEGTVCAGAHIRSRDGDSAEYSGASSNLFAAARPLSVRGWPDMPSPPANGDPVLFASGGAMLIERRTFLDVGGFDPAYFAYFEDVDLGWRLWVLGHKIVYAPGAVVRHLGAATGSRSAVHRRYTLWECNTLATILKNYESGRMELILSTALLLQYKRALLATGDAIDRESYAMSAPPDESRTNTEQLSKVSLAHLAAIDRFNSLLPHLMSERRDIQARRKRPDSEILPLLGHAWQPQFAGTEYADASRALFAALAIYELTGPVLPNRVVVLATPADDNDAAGLASSLAGEFLTALGVVGTEHESGTARTERGFTRHTLPAGDPLLSEMLGNADAILVYPGALPDDEMSRATHPVALLGHGLTPPARVRELDPSNLEAIKAFCAAPRSA